MAEIVLFHHAQGRTEGVLSLAARLEAAGHEVHTPDVYEGRTFDDLDAGIAHAAEVGFEEVRRRGVAAVEGLPAGLVYVGLSLGAMPAQLLAQTRPGARGAVLLHAAVPLEFFGPWPDGVRAQIHTMADDELGDVAEARQIADEVPTVELFLYDGDRHLFTDDSLPAHDPVAAELVEERVLRFLDEVG